MHFILIIAQLLCLFLQ